MNAKQRKANFKGALALMLAVALVRMVFVAPAFCAPKYEQPLHVYPALLGVEIQITADASLRFVDKATGQPILEGGPPLALHPRPNKLRPDDYFTARAPEGIKGGRRGHPGRADDDGDGLLNEDPLDGRDNDGDGLLDEDFAAISDAMVVVDIGQGTRRAEFYHWAYSHLMSAVFFTLSGESDQAGISDFHFEAPGVFWRETELNSRHHSISGRTELDQCNAWVAWVPGQSAQDEGLWAGVMILDDDNGEPLAAMTSSGRNGLDLLHGGRITAVACVAESWLQLNRILCESRRVHSGVLDPVTSRRTPWVVPPRCSVCIQAGNPEFSWSLAGEEDLLLNIDVGGGCIGLVDPDLFFLGGTPLGSPVQILWKPKEGDSQQVRWTRMTPGLLLDPVKGLSDPFGSLHSLLGHDAAGRLTLRFMVSGKEQILTEAMAGNQEQPTKLQLSGRWLDGRPLRALAACSQAKPNLEKAQEGPHDQITIQPGNLPSEEDNGLDSPKNRDSGPSRLSLAPELLQGWPNPFREEIQVRFKVPLTMGSAFELEDDYDFSSGMKMESPVPWETGEPFVTIKIYRINGQELVTLYQDYSNSGETTVKWDGADASGRTVASGPYFCKLQMDDWSVTQRIVFIR